MKNTILINWIKSYSTAQKAADAIDVSLHTIQSWAWGKRNVSFKSAYNIELVSKGKYTAKQLRPDLFGSK